MNIRSKNGTSVPQLGNCVQDPSRDPARVKSAGWMRSVAMRIVGGLSVLGTPARAGVAAAFLLVTLTAYAATNFPSPLTNTATVTVPCGYGQYQCVLHQLGQHHPGFTMYGIGFRYVFARHSDH